MKSKPDRTLIITTIMCLIPIILGIILYNKLPDKIPVHFDNAGTPDRYFTKAITVFILPVAMSFINLYVYIRYSKDPKVDNASVILRRIAIWLVPILSIVLIPTSFFISMGVEIPIVKAGSVIAGILIVIWGNYLPKCRQNYTLGFKLPWTLDDENNWKKTHRFAGFIWVLGGFIIILSSLFITWYLQIVIIILLVVVPIIYSYYTYNTKNKGAN